MTEADFLVVDTSAAVAILSDEPSADWLADALAHTTAAVMPAATYLELGMVLEARFGPRETGIAARFVRDAEIDIVDVTVKSAERALESWRRFGKGRHPAKLNFGDCIVYGVAAELDWPIMCVGEDFVQTDIAVLRPVPGGTA